MFQKEFKLIVIQAEDMPMEVFCALANSNIKFMSNLRSFVDKVKSAGVLKEEEIMASLCYNNIIKNFAQISNTAFTRIEQVLHAQLDLRLNESRFKKLNLERFLTSALEPINTVIQMMMPAYGKKMWRSVFDHLCVNYLIKCLEGIDDYKVGNLNDLIDKIIKDRTFIKDVFEANIQPKDLHEGLQTIRYFEKALTEPKMEIVEQLYSMAKKLKAKYNPSYTVELCC